MDVLLLCLLWEFLLKEHSTFVCSACVSNTEYCPNTNILYQIHYMLLAITQVGRCFLYSTIQA